MQRNRRLPYLAALVATAALLLGAPLSQAATAPGTSAASKGSVKKLAFAPYRINGQPIHAITLTDFRQFAALSIPDMERIKSDGFNMVTIYVYRFMSGPTVNVQKSGVFTEPDASLEAAITAAHAVGLQVQLIPTISVGPGIGAFYWRGAIHPTDVNAFFNSYRAMTNHYATLATQYKVDLFGVGSEMISLENQSAEWRQTIGEVRQHYTGPITYFTVWATIQRISWWDAITYPAVSTYMSLASASVPSYQDIANGWNKVNLPILHKAEAFVGRPLLVDEVGYTSAMGAATHPEKAGAGVPEPALQDELYRAYLDIVSKDKALDGVSFYNWSAYAQGPLDTSYSPKGKAAECEIVKHWAPAGTSATECSTLGFVAG